MAHSTSTTGQSASAIRFEELIGLLRDAWREGPRGTPRRNRAIELLRNFRSIAPSHEAERHLEELIERLAGLPMDAHGWRDGVGKVGQELQALRPLLGLNTPAHEKGTLNAAVRQTKQEKQRLAAEAREERARIESGRTYDPAEPIIHLPSVGEKLEKTLEKLGIRTIGDLLRHVPREHLDYGNTQHIGDPFFESSQVVFRGTIHGIREVYGRGKPRVEAMLRDQTGMIDVTWFTTYVTKQISDGDELVIRGTLKSLRNGYHLSPIEWFPADSPDIRGGYLLPIYPLTKGLTQKRMRMWTHHALEKTRPRIVDWIAEIRPIVDRHRDGTPFIPLDLAYQYLHYPPTRQHLEEARSRMAFDNLLLLQIGLIQRKAEMKRQVGAPMLLPEALDQQFRQALPFRLTNAQNRALREILRDMAKAEPMTRLLQGDVGSGKTVVAAMAAFTARHAGYQTAIMAPTEILAEQHHRSFRKLLGDLPEEIRPRVALLTGSTKAKERKQIDAALAAGECDILIGTHAIIEDRIAFPNLGLVVIDEQHRFGVHQRGQLMQKAHGITPHVLTMTATPIPKTLNHVVHGDLDVSVIDERPPGRVEIETFLYGARDRRMAEMRIREEVAKGHQVFVICPLVKQPEADEMEDDERTLARKDAKAAESEKERLQAEVFPDLLVDVVHGQMPSRQKDEVMTRFRNHAFDILVATSVIEVGIDIPNATVILIEGAERFGLSQLHQLRGRVGRGTDKSYCLLLSESTSAASMERLGALVATNDGFLLAQKDLELRGPGDFIGTRQSGLPEFDWVGKGFDNRLLDRANKVAETILGESKAPLESRYPRLAEQLARFWASTESLDATQA